MDDIVYQELCAYTLTHGHAAFIHQHVVDAWAVQRATPESKPIGVAFGLVGLYLHVEQGLTGREVQLAHMKLAKRKQDWPRFALPDGRGAMTPAQVMAAPPGELRDRAIHAWCESVWEACLQSREDIIALLERNDVHTGKLRVG